MHSLKESHLHFLQKEVSKRWKISQRRIKQSQTSLERAEAARLSGGSYQRKCCQPKLQPDLSQPVLPAKEESQEKQQLSKDKKFVNRIRMQKKLRKTMIAECYIPEKPEKKTSA